MRTIATLLVIGAALAVAACGSSGSGGAAGSSSGGGSGAATTATKVDIKDFKYAPHDLQVSKGAKVTFTNSDTAPHTATEKSSQAFDTGRLNQGQSKALTFDKAGTFTYYCVYHAFMKGKVTVK